jgi:hypothetical protein
MQSEALKSALFSSAYWHASLVGLPTALWLVGGLLLIAAQIKRVDWLFTSALVCGVIGTSLGWALFEPKSPVNLIPAADLIGAGVKTLVLENTHAALVFQSVAWGLSLLLFALRHKPISNHMLAGLTRALVLVALLIGFAYGTLSHQRLGAYYSLDWPAEWASDLPKVR